MYQRKLFFIFKVTIPHGHRKSLQRTRSKKLQRQAISKDLQRQYFYKFKILRKLCFALFLNPWVANCETWLAVINLLLI